MFLISDHIFVVKQNDTALIQIYIIAEDNRVVFTFQNSAAYVIEKRIFVSINIFD